MYISTKVLLPSPATPSHHRLHYTPSALPHADARFCVYIR